MRMIEFLLTAWERWVNIGINGRDPSGFHLDGMKDIINKIPPFVLTNVPIHRNKHQQPSTHLLGKVGFYSTEQDTPIFNDLQLELINDAALVEKAVDYVLNNNNNKNNNSDCINSSNTVYMIPTHPGHHAAYDCYGGYCYVNHAAACADLIKKRLSNSSSMYNNNNDIQIQQQQIQQQPKIVILDIDYHCGNGTASIFYNDPNVYVISIHCHPDYEYPFHSGFHNQIGSGEGIGTTLHIPLLPKATWNEHYKFALEKAIYTINNYKPNALIISMGLDTYDLDPCAVRRAGFCLKDNDYIELGKTLSNGLIISLQNLPTIFIQEGGYRMDKIGQAAVDIVTSFVECRKQQNKR